MRLLTGCLAMAVLCALAADPLLAQGRGRGGKAETPPQTTATVVVTYGFTPRDREIIVAYYRKQPSGLPPGLAKRERLPPGLEKQLRRNGALPPGLQKQIQPFPLVLERQLTPLPSGYRRGIVGAHIVV